jgi:hypothetical protein
MVQFFFTEKDRFGNKKNENQCQWFLYCIKLLI